MSGSTAERVWDNERPKPAIDAVSAPYWESLRAHAARFQRCDECSKFMFPPAMHCPHCLSSALTWTPVSGKGTVYSCVTVNHPPAPEFAKDVPYNVALVDLDEGVRVWTNVVGIDPQAVKGGMAVQAQYDEVAADLTLLRFRPR